MTSLSIAAVRHALKYVILVVEAALLIAVLAAAALAWRLSQGPLALNDLAPYLETELAEISPGYQFDVAGVSLSWRRSGMRPMFEVSDVAVRSYQGAVVASLRAMEIRVDLSSLLAGEIVVEHVRLFGPAVQLSRRADGGIDIGLASAPVSSELGGDTSGGGAAWLAAALAPRDVGPPGAALLDTIEIRDFTLIIDDRSRGKRWTVPGAQLQLLRQANDIQWGASLPLAQAGEVATIDLAGRYDYATRALSVTASFSELKIDTVGDLLGLAEAAELIALPISGTVDAEIAGADSAPAVSALKFDLKAGEGRIVLPDRLGGPRALTSAAARGSIGADFDAVTLDEVILVPAGIDTNPTFTVAGRASGLKGVPEIAVTARSAAFSLTALTQLWPAEVSRSTRAWIDKNLSGGGLSNLTASVALSGPSLDEITATSLDLGVDLAGIRVHYVDGLPDIEQTSGRLKMDLKAVTIDVTAAHIPDPVSGQHLRIPGAVLRMGDLDAPRTFVDFTIDIEGGLADVLRFIDNPPLEYARKMQVAAAGAGGDVKVKLKLDFPLIKALKLADLAIDIDAEVTDGHIEKVTFGLPLDDADLKLHVTDTFLDASGTAMLGPIRTGLTWHENFSGGEFRSQYALDAIIENDHRPLVALGRPPFVAPYMDGAVRTEVVYTVRRDGVATLAAEADFTNVALAVPELNWRKEPGVAASGRAEVMLREGKLVAVDSFSINGGEDLASNGRVEFGPENTLARVVINESRIGANTLAADLALTADGVMDLEVRGREVDVSYFWKDLGKDESRSSADDVKQPLRLKAALDRMRLSRDGDFEQVRLIYAQDAKVVQEVDFSGRIGGGTPVTLTLGPGEGGRSFKAASADAGGVLRAIGLFDDIVGGALYVSGAIASDGAVAGTAEISDFKLVDAPLVARVLSVAALTGIGDELAGNGISFKTLKVPFIYARSTLRLADAEMYGSSLGMTMQGNYSFGESVIDIEGTLVPAYALNSAFNDIPVVGDILTGGEKGSGIFAATYRWNGPTATTGPTVNPLAALTPGFLRKFFSIFGSSPAKPEPTREELAPG